MSLSFTVTYDADRWNPTDMCEAAMEKKTLIQMFIHHLKGCIHLMSNSLEKIREVIVLNVALKTLGHLILILKCTVFFFIWFF